MSSQAAESKESASTSTSESNSKTICVSVTPIHKKYRKTKIYSHAGTGFGFGKTDTMRQIDGRIEMTSLPPYEAQYDDTYKHTALMEYFGLDDFDSYYTLLVDNDMTGVALRMMLDENSDEQHRVLMRKVDASSLYGYKALGLPTGLTQARNSAYQPTPESEAPDAEYKALSNCPCYKIDHNGVQIIILFEQKASASGPILNTYLLTHGSEKLTESENMGVLTEFARTVRGAYDRKEKKKFVLNKMLMVYTNYRKGDAGASAAIMMSEAYQSYGSSVRNILSDWKMSQAVRARSFDSIYLNEQTKQSLIADLEDFMSDDTMNWYRFHDIPSKRSYLFYGPPGTGKTSTVKAIAGKYNMELYIMKVTREMDDQSIMGLVEQLPARSILLIEDVDAIFDHLGNKGDAMQSLTFSGLMNILDGITGFTSQIIILTTNHREKINRESLRIGRIDHELEFGYMDDAQIQAMLESFYEKSDRDAIKEFIKSRHVTDRSDMTPAELQEVIIRSKNKGFEYLKNNFTSVLQSVRSGRANRASTHSLYN